MLKVTDSSDVAAPSQATRTTTSTTTSTTTAEPASRAFNSSTDGNLEISFDPEQMNMPFLTYLDTNLEGIFPLLQTLVAHLKQILLQDIVQVGP